jgi:YVTN family beta-propeller protein
LKTVERSWAAAAVVACVIGAVTAARSRAPQKSDSAVPLPTSHVITPEGSSVGVGSFPANLAVSPDGKYIAVTDTGFRESLSILSAADGRVVSQIVLPSATKGHLSALYDGLCFAPAPISDNYLLYASRGPEDRIAVYTVDPANGKLTDTGRSVNDPVAPSRGGGPNFVAGIAASSDAGRLYVANNETSPWTGQKGSVSILDVANNKVLGRTPTPGFPYAIAAVTVGPNKDRKAFVASERDGVVSVLDVRDPAMANVTRDIPTGDHPMALLLDRAQRRCFVANSGSDTVSVIDTATDAVTATIVLRPTEAHGLPGATPTGLALSRDESRLYVTLGDMNAVAVVALTPDAGTLKGYIPAGWYPTAVAVDAAGDRLFVASAKGVQARNANKAPVGPKGEWGQYVDNIIEGAVSTVAVPGDAKLAALTDQVLANNRLRPSALTSGPSALPATEIKHVFYIVKENRTYDQILGDLPQGNGDAALTLFGRSVTPNQHALAERFVLLDNFYDCAETSGDGWNWTVSGMANEYTIRNLPFNYSGRGRSYDFEGTNNGVAVDLQGIPDVAAAPAGYLWDDCARHGISYRNYGFFNAFGGAIVGPPGTPLTPDNSPTKRALSGARNDENYFRFDMTYTDSDAWQRYATPAPKQKKSYGAFAAPSRYSEWKRELDGYVQRGDLPAFVMMRLPRDHTQGTEIGLNTPRAMVCDNDFGVGEIVDAISHSPYWKDSATFVIEDDAQSGHDHVDAHRSTCFVISPFVKRSTVDHRFYNTDSVLRTMENLLGIPPMCQYDANAPLLDVFSVDAQNTEPYAALLPPKEIVCEVNGKAAYKAALSSTLDFRSEDRVPDAVLNDILWHSVKGALPEPAPRRTLRNVSRADND